MKDYGQTYRKLFLKDVDRRRNQERRVKLLLLAATLYFAAHGVYFICKQIAL